MIFLLACLASGLLLAIHVAGVATLTLTMILLPVILAVGLVIGVAVVAAIVALVVTIKTRRRRMANVHLRGRTAWMP